MVEEQLRPMFVRAMSSAMMYGVHVRTNNPQATDAAHAWFRSLANVPALLQ
jgi:hypothetical protein